MKMLTPMLLFLLTGCMGNITLVTVPIKTTVNHEQPQLQEDGPDSGSEREVSDSR
jgi:hypothetical protein